MKKLTSLLVGLILTLCWSCKDAQDTSTYEINTELNVDITVTAKIPDESSLKMQNAENDYSFHGTGIFCLANNTDLGKMVCDIQHVKGRPGCTLTFSGIEAGNEINYLFLQWDSKTKDETDFDMQNTADISSFIQSSENGTIEIELTAELFPLVNCIDSNPDCMYRIDVFGTSNFDISSTAKLKVPITTENKMYNSRFSLF